MKTFNEIYESQLPLRSAACKEYYNNITKFKTIEQAKRPYNKGQWICLVNTPGNDTFYVLHLFAHKWVKAGNVFGMWNELTLIEKI